MIQAGKNKTKEGVEFIGRGDDTFDLKVPRVVDRTASRGSLFGFE